MSKNMGFKDSPLGLIPDDWEYTKLSNITNIKRGASPRPIDNPIWFADEGRGWVRINDVTRSNGHLYSTEQYLSPLGVTKSVPVNVGQLIMSICATIGEPAIVEIDVCIHDGFVVFDQYEKYLTTKFLYHFLRFYTPNFQNYGQTGTQANLNTTIVGATPIALPPRKEQEKIAEILDKVDSAIALTEALIKKLKQIKAGLLQDLLTRGLDDNGELRNPDTHPEHFKDSPLGKIPINWEVVKLEHFMQPSEGIKPGPFGSSITKDNYTSSGYKIYGQEQVIAGSLSVGDYFISIQKYRQLRSFAVQENDVLMSLVGTTGKLLIVEKNYQEGVINPRLIRLRPDLKITSLGYLKNLLESFLVRQQLDRISQGGTMEVLSATVLRQLILPKPPINEQEKIAKILDTQEKAIKKEEEYLKKIKQKKQGLMEDLLTGKVRVNHLKN